MTVYSPRTPWRCERRNIRGVNYNIRQWGNRDGRPILFLHGTQDSSITFQFVVDQLRGDWSVLAPDWRGHGHSGWVSQGYWFHEFVLDLDRIVTEVFGGEAVPIVGHSLGGNIASVFAGLRPERLSHLISLDGFGPLTSLVPVDVRQIMTRVLSIPEAHRVHATYPDLDVMNVRLMRSNPRLRPDMAAFLALHLSSEVPGGGRQWLFDPSHQMSLPSLHTMDEWGQIWSGVRVPVLWVQSQDRRPAAAVNVPGEIDRRAAMMPGVVRVEIQETGHNLHHDDPRRVAALIESFVESGHPSDAQTDRSRQDGARASLLRRTH